MKLINFSKRDGTMCVFNRILFLVEGEKYSSLLNTFPELSGEEYVVKDVDIVGKIPDNFYWICPGQFIGSMVSVKALESQLDWANWYDQGEIKIPLSPRWSSYIDGLAELLNGHLAEVEHRNEYDSFNPVCLYSEKHWVYGLWRSL